MPASSDLILTVANLEAAVAFYQQHLGLSVSLRQTNLVGLDAGPIHLYLEQGAPLGPVLEFFVADLTGAKADLVSAGCEIVEEDPSIPRCYIRDPFGLLFNLAERKTGAS